MLDKLLGATLRNNNLMQISSILAEQLGLASTGLGFFSDMVAFRQLTGDQPDLPLPPGSNQEEVSLQEQEDLSVSNAPGSRILLFLIVIFLLLSCSINNNTLSKEIDQE